MSGVGKKIHRRKTKFV